jgi:hypothetical protein
MNKRAAFIWGFLLIIIGVLALAYNLATPWLPVFFRWLPWRLWPFSVIALGLCFVIPPLLPRRGNLGGMFIPGFPLLAVGSILLVNSLFNAWDAWAWLWPMMVTSLAVGFLFAAWRLRVIWLLIPAIILGANGLLMQFCALTGQWSVWAVLWTIEPLSVGLALLLVSIQKRAPGLLTAGLILCTVAGFATLGMSFIIPGPVWLNLLGPSIILFVGFVLLLSNPTRSRQQRLTVEE